MQSNFLDDTVWNDLDDDDFEQCIVKEIEILSQNPSFVKDDSIKKIPQVNRNGYHSNNYLPSTSVKSSVNCAMTNEGKNTWGNVLNKTKSCKVSANDISKVTFTNGDPIFLQMKIDELLREKAKLEEDSYLKKGEIANLRCEMKRREARTEAQRIDHSVALEAAEQRAREKCSKEIELMNLKVKKMEQEIDKLQGNLCFKNHEIEELMEKYKTLSNLLTTSGRNVSHDAPFSKRRKTSLNVSPSKNLFNFENR